MSDQFVAEMRIFPFNFPPTGWAFCDGQLMPISQNTALFSLLGTTYGGDGKSTFALPDLQGAAPMQPGQGQGLSLRDLGEMSGTEAVTLLVSEIPAHTHQLSGCDADATTNLPGKATPPPPTVPPGQLAAKGLWDSGTGGGIIGAYSSLTPNAQMNFQALTPAGGGLPHNNMQPYLTLNFCIALQGIFPQRP
jgi:microcystin-dependent protein